MALFSTQDALDYHSKIRPGKIEVLPVKPCRDQRDLSLAYSPGVAETCKAIQENPEKSWEYTSRGNLVGVVSNGTAVLGLGNIGATAAKPVMEGKGVLFKAFADIDCFDINLDLTDPEKFCEAVKAMEPTFGGINLEDIKAPECFYIEKCLKEEMKIPVFHDDQHGTAIITAAALLNSLEITGRKIGDLRMIVSGAGAAAISTARLYKKLGVNPEGIALFDSKGHVHAGRDDLNEEKLEFAGAKAFSSMADALKGANLFLGLSRPGLINGDMLKAMAETPLIFACANPVPEISYPEAKAARPDGIMGTGRSDFPNQINNVSGFPFIFRGALDVRATDINDEMKLAAARALATLAREAVPDYIKDAYGGINFSFGPEYIIPKPLDRRLIEYMAPAVAEAAMQTGTARIHVEPEAYRASLRLRMESARERMENLVSHYGW